MRSTTLLLFARCRKASPSRPPSAPLVPEVRHVCLSAHTRGWTGRTRGNMGREGDELDPDLLLAITLSKSLMVGNESRGVEPPGFDATVPANRDKAPRPQGSGGAPLQPAPAPAPVPLPAATAPAAADLLDADASENTAIILVRSPLPLPRPRSSAPCAVRRVPPRATRSSMPPPPLARAPPFVRCAVADRRGARATSRAALCSPPAPARRAAPSLRAARRGAR